MSSNFIRLFRPSGLPRLVRAGAAAALLVGFCVAATAAASPLDSEAIAAQQKVLAHGVSTILIETAEQLAAETTPVPTHDPVEFERAIYSAAEFADEVARYDAAVREAAEIEAQQAAMRFRGGPSDAGLAALRACESSGNYASVNSSGTYRGAYQFSQQTWNSIASRYHAWLVGVDPAAASPADQDAQARALYVVSGRGQWPHCGRNLG